MTPAIQGRFSSMVCHLYGSGEKMHYKNKVLFGANIPKHWDLSKKWSTFLWRTDYLSCHMNAIQVIRVTTGTTCRTQFCHVTARPKAYSTQPWLWRTPLGTMMPPRLVVCFKLGGQLPTLSKPPQEQEMPQRPVTADLHWKSRERQTDRMKREDRGWQ